MVRFFLFLLSYAINPAIILMVPDKDVAGFLYSYAGSSAIFSFILLITFSSEWAVRRIAYWVPLISCVLLALIALYGKSWLWIFYPYSILIGDYITTQSGSEKISNSYRIVLIISALPIVIFPQYFYELIALRSLINIIYVFVLITLIKSYHVLAIRSPVKWILITYTFYSGSLLVVPQLAHGDPAIAKAWFVGIQVGIGLLLKKLDFSIRAINNNPQIIFKAMDFIVFLLPVILVLFFRNYTLFVLYIISALAIKNLKLSAASNIKPR